MSPFKIAESKSFLGSEDGRAGSHLWLRQKGNIMTEISGPIDWSIPLVDRVEKCCRVASNP